MLPWECDMQLCRLVRLAWVCNMPCERSFGSVMFAAVACLCHCSDEMTVRLCHVGTAGMPDAVTEQLLHVLPVALQG
jgi:hypothetical protein